MFSFLFKKENQLDTLILQYLENLTRTQEHFVKAMDTCLDEGVCGQFSFLIDQTHKFESKADEIREEVNLLMYSRALIPESREDIMNLLEHMDVIPRIFELILHLIRTQKLKIPRFIEAETKDLIRISVESCELMIRAGRADAQEQGGHPRPARHHRPQREPLRPHRALAHDQGVRLRPGDLRQAPAQGAHHRHGRDFDQADRVSKRVNIMTLKRRV